MDKAVSIVIGLNQGLATVKRYGHLDSTISFMSTLRQQEAFAAAALLSNTDGSVSSFPSREEKGVTQTKVKEHYVTTRDLLSQSIRGLKEFSIKAAKKRTKERIIRLRWNAESRALDAVE